MKNHWIAVACADHARRASALPDTGYMQVCHGKRAPLLRVAPGDVVVYYAPRLTLGGSQPCQAFVSLGVVRAGAPYAVDMGGGFVPVRRDVRYLPAREAPIHPLLDRLEFVEDRRHWGAKFRFGLFAISAHDMAVIAQAMAVDLDLDEHAPPRTPPPARTGSARHRHRRPVLRQDRRPCAAPTDSSSSCSSSAAGG